MKKRKRLNIVGIVPARMASSRFPGKPLAKICGIPMVGHVYFRSRMSRALSDVYMATCDDVIKDYAESVGAKCVMTKDTHVRASDRAAEAMLKIEKETGKKIDIAVMIQGDEPMLHPDMLDEVAQPVLEDKNVHVVNLMAPLKTWDEHEDANIVKVVVDKNNFALYFSREPIPTSKKRKQDVPMRKQIAIIPFRRDVLIQFNELEATPLEIAESVDMLRFLEHGIRVKMVLTKHNIYGVDTPGQLRSVEKRMKNDPFIRKYKR